MALSATLSFVFVYQLNGAGVTGASGSIAVTIKKIVRGSSPTITTVTTSGGITVGSVTEIDSTNAPGQYMVGVSGLDPAADYTGHAHYTGTSTNVTAVDQDSMWSEFSPTVAAGALSQAVAGAAGGTFISGSNAATTIASLTVTGAVAFQSTFAVTTSTSLAALSCSTLTASGAVAFQSTLATTGTTTFNAFTITNNLLISGTTTHTGATTFTGAVSGTNASNDLRINGAVPGASNGILVAGSNAATTFATGSHFIGTVDTVTDVTAGVTVMTNNDKTGYSLTQAFPSNFAMMLISSAGNVGIDWANISNPTTTQNLSGTTVNAAVSGGVNVTAINSISTSGVTAVNPIIGTAVALQLDGSGYVGTDYGNINNTTATNNFTNTDIRNVGGSVVGNVAGVSGSVSGDIGGKILGGGVGTIIGIGTWSLGSAGVTLASHTDILSVETTLTGIASGATVVNANDRSGAQLATPTNITAGTVTNLTNAPTSGDFTATMKTSLNAATPVATLANGSIATATFAAGATIPRVTLADTVTNATHLSAGSITPPSFAPSISGTVVTATSLVQFVVSGLNNPDPGYVGAYLEFTGNVTTSLKGISRIIAAYIASSGTITLQDALGVTMATGDTFQILGTTL